MEKLENIVWTSQFNQHLMICNPAKCVQLRDQSKASNQNSFCFNTVGHCQN